MTAYTGLLNIGNPKPGETVVVAAAAGPVGATVGQIAKLKGCRTVGIAAGNKLDYITAELGFDAALDRRSPDLKDELREACPLGIDIYFENVGGVVWEAVLPLLNDFARIPVCGLIAHYNDTQLPPGPDRMSPLMRMVLTRRLRIQGFIVSISPRSGAISCAMSAPGSARARSNIASISSTAWRRRPMPSSSCSGATISARRSSRSPIDTVSFGALRSPCSSRRSSMASCAKRGERRARCR